MDLEVHKSVPAVSIPLDCSDFLRDRAYTPGHVLISYDYIGSLALNRCKR